MSTRFADPFYSLSDGLAESRHVFLDGNALPGRLRPGLHVAELGFGTGLNLLALLALWRDSGATGRLHFTSFELAPLPIEVIARAWAGFPELAPVAAELAPVLAAALAGDGQVSTDTLVLTLVKGDARQTLPRWAGRADAWFLDGFAPARNPEMWEAGLMAEVARHTVPGGTAATYTAAGAVRRALAAAGFEVARRPGFGRKRHMTVARLPSAGGPAAPSGGSAGESRSARPASPLPEGAGDADGAGR